MGSTAKQTFVKNSEELNDIFFKEIQKRYKEQPFNAFNAKMLHAVYVLFGCYQELECLANCLKDLKEDGIISPEEEETLTKMKALIYSADAIFNFSQLDNILINLTDEQKKELIHKFEKT